MASQVKVIIAGAGIAGLSLAIMLERANIQYCVLERAAEFRPLGSAICLSAQVLRVFDQLGILEQMRAKSKPLMGIDYHKQDLTQIGTIDNSFFRERYGYENLFFARPDLMQVLLDNVPKEKIHWGKKILSTMQNKEGVMCRCADGTTFDGDILVGADGAYSAVRQSLYKNLAAKGVKVSKSDTGPLRFDQFALLGVTKPVPELFPAVNDETTRMSVVLADKLPYIAYVRSLHGGRIGWTICGKLLSPESHGQENFRFSDWGAESIEEIRQELDHIPVPLGGTIGFLIDNTQDISKVMLEDRYFHCWYENRTVLIGDACHKLIPAGGQGANQSILDAICLANLLAELPSPKPEDITAVFARYFEIRSPTAKKCVDGSAKLSKLMNSQGKIAEFIRGLVLNMPAKMTLKQQDTMFTGRPILNYLPQIELKGTAPNSAKDMTLKKGAVAV
ncbi:hypothetical protein BGW41_001405 [Actinomortierella wolfii]|nr:hypothetical protein BGW41_001405 [Actinomortierella wolfii]